MDVIVIPGFWLDASWWVDVRPAAERAGRDPLIEQEADDGDE